MNSSITWCVVVTHNRIDHLKRCIDAIRRQSYHVKQIVVVNNDSSDGTDEWLKAQQDILTITQGNQGSAGGQHAGMKYAIEHGAEWVWIMDDDGRPTEECLENLHRCTTEVLQYVAPALFTESGKPHFDLTQFGDRDIVNLWGGPYNGILLGAKLIRSIGYPISEMFAWGDEYEYANRVIGAGWHVALCKSAVYFHPSTLRSKLPIRFLTIVSRNLLWEARISKSNYMISKKTRLLVALWASILLIKRQHFFSLNRFSKMITGIYLGMRSLPKECIKQAE